MLLSILGVRLLLPIVSFGSNLLLLKYFGVDRFAILATLLQGSLLATVLLKFGTDDALLYGRVKIITDTQRWHSKIISLSLFGSIFLVIFMLTISPGRGFLENGLQVLILGFLNSKLAIIAMRLQVLGHVWIGNFAQTIAAPIAVILGATLLPLLLPNTKNLDDLLLFFFSISFGFIFWLISLNILQKILIAKIHDISKPEQQSPPSSKDHRINHSLWCLQIIDVILLSGDLIVLGLFGKLTGLEQYVAASRLAVASAFVLIAAEQLLATMQRNDRLIHIPNGLIPGAMLLMIPLYVLLLHILGLRAGEHYDLVTLTIFMSVSACQFWFLRSKVRWAGQANAASLQNSISITLVIVTLSSCGLCWLSLEMELTAAMRAAFFGALALLTRWVLSRKMNTAVGTSVSTIRKPA